MLGFFIKNIGADNAHIVLFPIINLIAAIVLMHPFAKILCFILLLLMMSVANNVVLVCMLMLVLILTFLLKIQSFLFAVRRMRWLFLSIIIIYTFGTPGELLPGFPVALAPTFEGLQLGVMQITKLLLALAALSLLFFSSSKQQLLLGLYTLLLPFKLLGLDVERFAARLMLTLDYVEELAAKDKTNFRFELLDEIDGHAMTMPEDYLIFLHKRPFTWLDKLVILLLIVMFVLMRYRGFA